MQKTRQYFYLKKLADIEAMIKSRIKNCRKTGHEASVEGAGEDQKPKRKRQKESELFHGFWFLKKISVFVICRKVIEKEITSLTYRDMVIRMVCASEECRHVNPVNLKDFRVLSEYMQQIPKGFESLPPRFSEKNH